MIHIEPEYRSENGIHMLYITIRVHVVILWHSVGEEYAYLRGRDGKWREVPY